MFDFLGRLAVSHPGKVCAGWLLLAVGLTLAAPNWQRQSQDDDIRFLPARYASVRGFRLLEQAFPQDVFACRAIFAVERPEAPLTSADFAIVDRMVEALNRLAKENPDLQLGGVSSYRDGLIGRRLISADRHCTLIQASLGTPYMAVQTRTTVDKAEEKLRDVLASAGASAPALHTTGPAGIGRDLIRASGESLDRTTFATIGLVVVVLLIVYRSPLLALIPLATIGVAVWVALQLLALVTLIPGVHLVNISQVFAIVILFGAGTDYCLFLISRYREELELGEPGPAALRGSVRAVGGALAASAGTVIVGLGLMGFAEFGKIRSAGPVIALALGVGLAASLTLTPALLRLGGKAVFWPSRPAVHKLALAGDRSRGVWDAISRVVVRRPAWIWAMAAIALLPLAALGLTVTPTFKPIGDLSPTAGSVTGLNVIQKRFTAGETGPITVLLSSSADWNSPAGRETIAYLSRGFARLENVAEIRSLTQPLGQPMPEPTASSGKGLLGGLLRSVSREGDGLLGLAARKAQAHYVATVPDEAGPRSVTRLDVVLRSDPFDSSSVATLELIETWLADLLPARPMLGGPVRAECYGVTVHTRDMTHLIESDRARVNGLVLAGIFVILLVLVRRLWLASYLLATVLLSYYATLGATALFASAWADRPVGPIEWRVPFFLFTILVAVGEDYNILMVSRALQETKRHGAREGLRRGLAKTGGTITACGLIMAGTFGTLMLAELGTLVQIGFALALGVALDTFVVRPFLVPAFMLMVWRDDDADESESTPARPTIRRMAG